MRYFYSVANTRDSDSVWQHLLRQSWPLLCVALSRSVILTVLFYHLYSWPWDIIVYTSRILVDTLVFFINWILCVLHLFRITNSSACSVCFYFAIIWRREQSFVGAQTVVSLLQTTQIISDVCFITDHVASPAQIQLQVWTETELSFFFTRGGCVSCLRACFGARLVGR